MMARRSSRAQGGGLLLYAVIYVAFLYAPILLLPLFSFNDSVFISFPLSGFTTRWYREMAADQAMQRALANTLRVGAVAALGSTVLGLLAAKALSRGRFAGRSLILALANLPLLIPEIVLGIALLLLVTTIGLPLSLVSVTIGHLLICLPFAIAVLVARLEGLDATLEEASRDLGENGWMTFWRVTFPLVLPGIVASLLLTFVVSFDDFMIAFFLSSTDATLPVYIFGELRFPARLPRVLALGAAILLGSALVIVAAERLRRAGAGHPSRA
jgi:spermidine/putrescine transport system permease protein